MLEKHKEQNCSHPIERIDMVEVKPTFVDCSPEIDADLEQAPVGLTEHVIAPMQINFRFNENGELESPIRNSFPKDDTDRDYYCYLCNRR